MDVLVVDDESHIRRMLVLQLKSAGFDVACAEDGEEALEAISESAPRLLITDCQMPRLDGIELCRKLAAEPITSTIPVILLTARGFELDDAQTAAAGNVIAVLSKPFSPGELHELVERRLRSRQGV